MTDAGELPRLPGELLRSWPGRFRSSYLLPRLYGQTEDGDDCLADSILAGIAAAQDEDTALDRLVTDGEFAVAELVLAQCASLSGKAVQKATNDIESGRSEAVSALSDRLSGLSELAAAADIDFDSDADEVERLAYESRAAASRLLDEHERRLSEMVEKRSRELRTRLEVADLPADTSRGVTSLINAGRLLAVRHLLDGGTLRLPGPEIQPPLPGWRWSEPPLEVLRWHVNPNVPHPRAFAEWFPPDESAIRLIQVLDGLNAAGEGSARAFAQALDTFLGPEVEPAPIHPVGGGFLTSVRNVFRGDPLARFHTASSVPLFIAASDADLAPPLEGIGHFLAVGSRLEPRGRGQVAVLSVRDLLRLATVPVGDTVSLGSTVSTGRAISLARLIGSQWSLAGLGARSAAELGTLLDGAEERAEEVRWQTLSWLADLLGLGGSTTAEALLFQTGGDLGVLHVLLEYAVQLAARQPDQRVSRHLHAWTKDRQATDQIETVVLRGCQSPGALAACWSAMAAAPAGTPLTFDAVVVAASLIEDNLDWAGPLRTGWEALARQWFTEPGPAEPASGEPERAETIQLRRCGVTLGLRRLAERRLRALAVELRDVTRGRQQDAALSTWTAYQFALSPRWPEYRQLLSDGAPADQLAVARAALEVPPEELIAEAELLAGQTDLVAVAGELLHAAEERYPGLEVDADIPSGTVAGIDPRAALTVLHGLISNAIDAVAGTGTVALAMRSSGDDVIIDIRDTGPGLAVEIDSAFRVFRQGFSTRSAERGQGLYLVRRLAESVGGDAELVSRANGHPVLSGAHFRVVLPRRHN